MDNITNLIYNKCINYDYILIHSDILYLLTHYDVDCVKNKFKELFIRLIETNKTIFIPSFNWDFCSTNKYHYKNSKSKVGTLSSWCLESDLFIRTNDPLYSFCVAGKDRHFFNDIYFTNAFGKHSIFDLIDKENTLAILINNQNLTMFHYYQQEISCPYRYLKKFKGCVEFENNILDNYEYEMSVKSLDVYINNEQYKKDSFFNKYIDNDIIIRYEENDHFFIDFINLQKIRHLLLDDICKDLFLEVNNKEEVKLFCCNKLTNIINNFIKDNLDKPVNIVDYKNNTFADLGFNNLLTENLSLELRNNNFNINKCVLYKDTINNIINMNVETAIINDDNFYKLLNKFSSKNIDVEKYKNSKLEHIGFDSLLVLQFYAELKKSNINIDLDFLFKENINSIINKYHELTNISSNNVSYIPLNNDLTADSINEEINQPVNQPINESANELNNFQKSSIIGLYHSVGSKKITNSQLENKFELDNMWIKKRTGIETRYVLDENEDFNKIIIETCKKAIGNANIKSMDIDLVILATSTPNSLFGDASKISYYVGSYNATAFDVTVACNGFVTGFIIANQFIENNNCKYAMVIGADCLSRWVDWNDKSTSVLFGDGVGVIILKNNNNITDKKINYILNNKGDLHESLFVDKNTTTYINTELALHSNKYNTIKMMGSNIYNFAISTIPQLINNLLSQSNLNKDNIKYFILHQANIRIINQIAAELNIDINKFPTNIDKYGNTSAASIPILLSELYQENLLNSGDLIMMIGFGAGVNYGGTIIKWTSSNIIRNKKIALIVGGTKGIGLEIAKKIIGDDYHVIIASRNDNKNIDYTDNLEYYKLDISNADNLKELNKYIIEKYNKLDLLVNSAGWEGISKKSIETEIDDVSKIININLTGVIYTINILIDLLKKSNATIINISSLSAGNPLSISYKRNLYGMTKNALGAYTRGLSGELKDICKIYCINPSFVNTEMADRICNDNNIDKNILNYTNIIEGEKELIEPEEIANIVNLLINNKTRYISGDEILILCEGKTSYMKYLYNNLTERDPFKKIKIDDIENLSIINNNTFNEDNYVCIFQGQGFNNNYSISKRESYEIIFKNNYHKKFKEITTLDLFETIDLLKNDLNNTYYQQLIIFMYSIVIFDLLKIEDSVFFEKTNVMIGYSVGEYSALVCSGKLSFEDGLKLLHLRSSEMKKISSSINTGMLKVIGLDEDIINKYLTNNIYISNDITDNIKIVSGDRKDLESFKINIEKINNIKLYDLSVDGAFHTKYYEPLSYKLEQCLININFKDTKIDVISNYKSIKYNKSNYIYLLKNQVFNRVDWNLSIKSLNNIKLIYEISITKPSLINLFTNSKMLTKSINI